MQVADLEAKARVVLTGLGFKEDMLQKPFSTLSGGWRMRCMLASALTHTSDVIVLDEVGQVNRELLEAGSDIANRVVLSPLTSWICLESCGYSAT